MLDLAGPDVASSPLRPLGTRLALGTPSSGRPCRVSRRGLAICLGSLLAGSVWTAHATPPPDASADAWLARARAAAQAANFSGTFVVTTDGLASSSRIIHFGQGKDSYERVESLDGPQRVVLRHNDAVHTVWPDSRLVLVEQRASSTAFPSIGDTVGAALDAHYRVDVRNEGRVAGRETVVLTLHAVDAHRYTQRLWLDRKTSMLLRSDVIGPRQEVLESSAFTDLALGLRTSPSSVLDGMQPRGPGWRTVRTPMVTSSLEREGWAWNREALPGFRLVSCVRRPVSPEVDDPKAPPPMALQAVFSDGLASVSVFVEDLQPSRHAYNGTQRTGATHTVTQRLDRYWITVVGDVPEPTARRFAASLSRKPR
jgi:sigma-E factor negative regulatory protein RseB